MNGASRSLGDRAQAMIDALATVTAEPGKLTRLYLTDEHREAAGLVGAWMRRAGLSVRMDAAGSMHGLLPAGREGPDSKRRLLVGSHIDTVVDAGRYDGTLGVIAGILAVEELRSQGVALPFALEILAFGDEEGVRFPKTLIGSSTVSGALGEPMLDLADETGVTIRDALLKFGGDPDALADEAYVRGTVLGYLEVHIEQGPVLDQAGLSLGVVSAIASQGRYRLSIKGEAGHAGTVPMSIRHDALVAAAQVILAIEEIATKHAKASCVATVGEIKAMPGAGNVIPGLVEFSLDLRAASDEARGAAASEIRRRIRDVGVRRGVLVGMETMHEKPVATCAPRLKRAVSLAIERVTGNKPLELMSGAGHDGQAMIDLTDIGMMFVRCRAGISHNPLESVEREDMDRAVRALVATIEAIAGENSESGR
jgi:allantoate deiminase